MWKSPCVHPEMLKVYHVQGTVLVSVCIFVNKMDTYWLKRWNLQTTCKAVNCFSNIAHVKYQMVTFHIRRKNSINSQSAFCAKSTICILYFVLGLQPVACSPHFVKNGLVLWFFFFRASLKSRLKYWSSKEILVRLSWPLRLMWGLYVEKLSRKSTMVEQWFLFTNWRRTQMRGLPIRLPLMSFRVVTACVEMNPLQVP